MDVVFQRNSLSEKIESTITSLEVVTKTLKIQMISKLSEKRKLVISTNWLDLFRFKKGEKVVETVIGKGKGMTVDLVKTGTAKSKLVYSRKYKKREDETLIDIRSQKVIDDAFIGASHAHIVFRMNSLKITPVFAAENRSIDKGLSFKLGDGGIAFTAIFDLLNTIKEKAFSKLEIELEDNYVEGPEYPLFIMQIRRMGYEVEHKAGGGLIATLGDGLVDETYKYKPEATYGCDKANFDYSEPLSTFSACSAGVDIAGIESEGFVSKGLIEYRPVEARDHSNVKNKLTGTIEKILKRDKTETGAICAALNSKNLKRIFNEDIYEFDFARVKHFFGIHNFMQVSLTCTDFSNLKCKADKIKHMESLKGTRDMLFPVANLIMNSGVSAVLVENVSNFDKSHESNLFKSRLKQLGFKVYTKVLKAVDFNGYTKRPRSFTFASKLDVDFEWPEVVERSVHLWDDIIQPNFSELRDVTHTKTISKAILSGRMRCINVGDHVAPSIAKSQSQQVKDSVYCNIEDRYYMPSNKLLKKMMGIDESFDTSLFSGELTSEIIGQSVCLSMHREITKAIKKHIMNFASIKIPRPSIPELQLSLI